MSTGTELTPYAPGGPTMDVAQAGHALRPPRGRVLVPPKGLCSEDFFHICDWPAELTEFDERRGLVLFHDNLDPDRSFKVGYTYAQIRWHRQNPRGTPLNFRRLVAAALASTRESHEKGGRRARRRWNSPYSVTISR